MKQDPARDSRPPIRVDAPPALGIEPPISSGGASPIDARDVSLRWLAGVVLTMITGSGLIGAAAYASLDRRSGPPEAPQLAAPPKREAASGDGPRKGDRLVKSIDMIAAKQTFRTPVAMKAGDKEVIRQRAFTRVVTPLTLASLGFGDDVPEFNPMRLMGESGGATAAGPEPAASGEDADVSFQTVDLMRVETGGGPTLSADEAASQIDEHVKNLIAAGSKPPLPIPPQLLLMRTSRLGVDPHGALGGPRPDTAISAPFSSIEVRMVPENVTLVPKAATTGAAAAQFEQRVVMLRRGETLEDVLRANGATREQARAAAAALAPRRGEAPVQEGQKLMLLLADLDGAGKSMSLVRLSAYADDKLEATVAARDSGDFVQIDRAAAGPAAKPRPRRKTDDEDEDEEDAGGMRLHASLYETALKQEVPRPIIDELVRVFSNDVDFQRGVSAGDSIDVFYGENEEDERRNELLYASITTRDETFRYYRYQSPDDNSVDFFDENGRSTGKFLIRKPVAAGELRSGFGMRYHPILRYSRPHTGVDWSGPIGTPIYAAGAGLVLKASWDSGGYGRRVEIQHANGYVTTYNHMSGFAKGVVEGVRVRQGQVIGYLGSTGLSTGPHLHYEVMVNGHFVDPMRIRVSRQKEFDGKALAEFKRERDRLDQLMAKAPNAAPTRVSQRK